MSEMATLKLGIPQITVKSRQELNLKCSEEYSNVCGIIAHAKPIHRRYKNELRLSRPYFIFYFKLLPATTKFPTIQKAAKKESILPRRDLG